MEKKRVRILMLGWEFPPFITGGLGKASHGLVKALSERADVTLVVPRTSAHRATESWRTIGTRGPFPEAVNSDAGFPPTHIVEAALDPYQSYSGQSYSPDVLDALLQALLTGNPLPAASDPLAPTGAPEAYGPNLLANIAAYTASAVQLISSGHFDIIHAHDWMTFPAALQLRQEMGTPVVMHVHSLETDRTAMETDQLAENVVYQLERTALAQADAIVAVSDYTRTQLVSKYGLAAEAITPVHNAVEPIKPFHIAKGVRAKLVVWVGRVTHQKGPDFLLDTVDRLVQRDPTVKFVVAGTGDQLPRLIEASAQRRLADKIFFTGFLNEVRVRQLLAQADVFFMPSASEPFGIAALEATQFGVPCVISRQSGVAEVLQSALKADHWDTHQLANYLYALLRYEGLRKELLAGARQELSELSWHAAAQQVMDLYEKVLAD